MNLEKTDSENNLIQGDNFASTGHFTFFSLINKKLEIQLHYNHIRELLNNNYLHGPIFFRKAFSNKTLVN